MGAFAVVSARHGRRPEAGDGGHERSSAPRRPDPTRSNQPAHAACPVRIGATWCDATCFAIAAVMKRAVIGVPS